MGWCHSNCSACRAQVEHSSFAQRCTKVWLGFHSVMASFMPWSRPSAFSCLEKHLSHDLHKKQQMWMFHWHREIQAAWKREFLLLKYKKTRQNLKPQTCIVSVYSMSLYSLTWTVHGKAHFRTRALINVYTSSFICLKKNINREWIKFM